MTILAPQHTGVGLPLPTYYPVNSPEYIALESTVFLHLYNDSVVDDTITVVATLPADTFTCILPAGEEIILGPFDLLKFGPTVELQHSHTADVTMAALVPYNIYETGGYATAIVLYATLVETKSREIYPSMETASTVTYPITVTHEHVTYVDNTAATVTYPDDTASAVTYPDHTDSTESWSTR
jgi:hypothetical protein